jgi:hypothetical protein
MHTGNPRSAGGQARRVAGARWVTAQGPQKIGAPKILRRSLRRAMTFGML